MFTFLCRSILVLTGVFIMHAAYATELLAASATEQPTESASTEGYINYRLPNGLQVVLQQDKRFPLVSQRLYVHAGSAMENDSELGISHVLEHMVFKGTKAFPKGEVSEKIEQIGGYINAATSFDYTVYITDVPADNWKVGLDVLKEMTFHPILDAKELALEQQVIVAELKRSLDNPMARIFQTLQATTFAGTSYAHPIIGNEKSITGFTRNDLKNYMQKHYQPQSMLLLMVGDFDLNEAKQTIDKIFAQYKSAEVINNFAPIDPSSIKVAGPVVEVEEGDWNKVYLGIAFPVVGQAHPASVNLDLITTMLGDGKSSYLYRKYRYDKQLVDSISINNSGFERTGMLSINVSLDADKVPAFWDEFTLDLAKLNDQTFTEEELSRARLNISDDLFRFKETLSGIATKLGYFTLFDKGQQSEDNYIYTLKNTGLSALSNQLKEYMLPEKLSVKILSPQGSNIDKAELLATLNKNWPVKESLIKEQNATSSNEVEIIELGQDRRIILIPDNTLPYINGSLMFTGGDALLDKDHQGLGTLASSLITRGTKNMTALELDDYLANHAAYFTANSGRQVFSFNFSLPAEYTNEIFTILGDTIKSPALLPQELDRVKLNVLAAIKSAEDSQISLANRKMFPFLFPEHTYGLLQLGDSEFIKSVTKSDIASFLNKQFKQPWTLAISGDFNREEILKLVEGLPKPSEKRVEVATPEWTKEKALNLTLPGREQAHIFLVFPTVPLGSEDAPALDLLTSALAGQSGLLFSELRDNQSLGYTVTAFPWSAQKAGGLIFYIGTGPSKVEQAKQGFLDIITDLKTKELPQALLDRAKNSIKGDYYRKSQSLDARAQEAATLDILGKPITTSKDNVDKVFKLTGKDVQNIAQKYLIPENAYWISVLP